MALSYNLGYQESISVHPTRRQISAGKPDSTFPQHLTMSPIYNDVDVNIPELLTSTEAWETI